MSRGPPPTTASVDGASAAQTLRIPVVAGQTVDIAGLGLGELWPLIVGPDLFLVAPNGNLVILQGFMALAASDDPPALLLEGGITVPGPSVVAQARDEGAGREAPPDSEPSEQARATMGDGAGRRDSPPTKVLEDPGETAGSGDAAPETDGPKLPAAPSRPPFVPVEETAPAPTAATTPVPEPEPPAVNEAALGGAAQAFSLDTATVTPFAGFTILHPEAGAILSLTVTLDDASEGVFTPASLAASGFADAGGGVYTLSATAAAGQAAIRQLAFDPTDDLAALGGTRATGFTVDASDGDPGDVSEATTTVTATRATGTGAADSVTLPFAVTAGTVDLLAGADSLTLADGTNVVTVSNVETIAGGSGGDTVTLGTAGSVALAGVETLIGSGGADTLQIDPAGLAVLDSLAGGAGADTLAFTGAGSYDLSALTGLSGFESLTSSGATTLSLHDAGGLTVTLDNASNTVTGGSGADSVTGGSGGDTLSGAGGADSLVGGDGADVLDGGAASDRLAGEAGSDSLTGGSGADRFLFTVADSQGAIAFADVIMDFEDGSDLIDISGIADFDGMNGSDFGDLTLTELVNAGGVKDGATDTIVTDATTSLPILVLDSISAGAGHTIDAADFVISA